MLVLKAVSMCKQGSFNNMQQEMMRVGVKMKRRLEKDGENEGPICEDDS
jgi:hypothetical protein